MLLAAQNQIMWHDVLGYKEDDDKKHENHNLDSSKIKIKKKPETKLSRKEIQNKFFKNRKPRTSKLKRLNLFYCFRHHKSTVDTWTSNFLREFTLI